MQSFIAAMLASFGLPSTSEAQVQQRGNIYDFGDSFQDANYQCTSFGTPLHACSNYHNTPMQLGSISGYTFSTHNDFAIGGTASGPGTTANKGTPPYPGYTTTYPNAFGQIAEFQALGRRIGADDLVMLTYAANDATVYGNPGASLGATVIGNLTNDVRSLINLGGRNFVLFGGVPFDRIDPSISAAADQAYYTTLNAGLPAAIAPFESSSLHLRILDVNTLYTRVLDNPSMYGFISGDCLTDRRLRSGTAGPAKSVCVLPWTSVGCLRPHHRPLHRQPPEHALPGRGPGRRRASRGSGLA